MTPELIREFLVENKLLERNFGDSGWSIKTERSSYIALEDAWICSQNVVEFCNLLNRTNGWNVRCFRNNIEYDKDYQRSITVGEFQVYCIYEILSDHNELEKEIREYDAS